MSTDYSIQMKANLDVSDAQQKLQKLGTVGTNATKGLEDAVRHLDQSIKQLGDSWKQVAQEQSKAIQNVGGIGKAAALGKRFLRGGQLNASAGLAESIFGQDSDVGKVIGGGLKGAAKGAVFGPEAALVGAIKGVKDAFEELRKAADKAAQKLWDVATKDKKDFQGWYSGEMQKRAFEQQKEAIPSLSNQELNKYITEYAAAKAKVTERLEAGQSDFQTDADFRAEIEALQENERKLRALSQAAEAELRVRGQWYDSADEIAQLQKEEAEAIKQRTEEEKKLAAAFEAQRAQEERTTQDAASLLTTLTKGESSRQFSEGLGNMTPGQLVSLIDELKKSRDELQAMAMASASEAMDTGDMSKYADAQNYYEQLQDVMGKLGQAESVLAGIAISPTKYGASIAQLMGDVTSSEAAKGYDVGGYANIEDAVWKQQLEQQRKIEVNTQKSANELSEVKTAVQEIRNKVESS